MGELHYLKGNKVVAHVKFKAKVGSKLKKNKWQIMITADWSIPLTGASCYTNWNFVQWLKSEYFIS